MNRISSIFAFVCLLVCSVVFTACGGSGYEPPRNVVQNLPDKIHVEYGYDIFVKDGNEYYCRAHNTHGSHRNEIYMKRELSQEVCVAQGYGGWLFITARYDNNQWILAADDLNTSPNEPAWHANDNNQNSYTKAEYNTRHGYSDVNSPLLDDTEHHKATQLANQTITIGTNQVECVVWEYEFDYNGTYSRTRYWFAADTGVYLKGLSVSDREANINTDGSDYGHPTATYYNVGESMDTALQIVSNHIGETRTKYVFPAEYV